MKTLAVSAVKSNNSYVNFAGKNQNTARRRAVQIAAGALIATGGVVAYKNRTSLINFLSEIRVSAKYFYLNTIKAMGN